MRESNKKQLNVLFSVLICVFCVIAAAVSLLGGGYSGAPSSAIVIEDGSEEGNVSGTSATLTLPEKVSITYGDPLPLTITCFSSAGGTVEASIVWSASLAAKPSVSDTGNKIVTVSYSGHDTLTGATLRLEVSKAALVLDGDWLNGYEMTYGDALPTYIGDAVNKNVEDNYFDDKEQFRVPVTLAWNHVGLVTVEEMGEEGYIEIGYSMSATGGKQYTENYSVTSGTMKIKVNKLVLSSDSFSGEATATEAYSTQFSKITTSISAQIRAIMSETDISAQVAKTIVDSLKFKVEGKYYNSTDLLPVLFEQDGLTLKSYNAVAELTTKSVGFSDESGNLPNFTISIMIGKMTLGSAQVKTVKHGIYNGTPKPASFTFAINKFTKDEVELYSDYALEYYQNNVLIAKSADGTAPVNVGIYSVKIFIDNPNYVTPSMGITVEYRITKNQNAEDFLEGVTYQGMTVQEIYNGKGVILVPFQFDGYTPKPEMPNTSEFKAHAFDCSYVILDGGRSVLNVGRYTVRFLFHSPNVADYMIDLVYEVYYIDANDADNGLDKVLDILLTKEQQEQGELVLEYSGNEYTTFDFLTRHKTYLDKYGIDTNMVLAYPNPVKEIGTYAATFELQSINHSAFEPITLNIRVIKKIVVIPNERVNLKFDAMTKTPIPQVSTGLNGIYASVSIVSITDAEGNDYTTSGVVNAGSYTFVYKLNENKYVQTETETVAVNVIIAKASKATLEKLIQTLVVFNNKERIDAKAGIFAPQADDGGKLAKYGVALTGTPDPFATNTDFVNVTFVFETANYDVVDGIFEYNLRYDVAEEANYGWIIAVVGGLVALVALAYVLTSVGKKKVLAAGVRPYEKTPTIYDKPTYKPDSPGPKPVKEKKEKPVKEPKAPKLPKPAPAPKTAAAPKPAPAPQKAAPAQKNQLDLMSNMKMGNSREIGKFSDTKVFKDRK
jgi:hypothetical protein